jgi:acid phosphatase type 7
MSDSDSGKQDKEFTGPRETENGMKRFLLLLLLGLFLQPVGTAQASHWGCNGVHVWPSESLAAEMAANPAGTTFCVQRGTHTVPNQISPESGDRLIGEPGLAVLRGGGGNRGFYGWANDVLVDGLIMENFVAPPQQGGALQTFGDRWTVTDNVFRFNRTVGLNLAGDGHVLSRNYIHDNSQLGASVSDGAGNLVSDNHFANNNTGGYDPNGDAGALKVIRTSGTIVRNNWSHDNNGVGLWLSIDNDDTLIENNTVEREYHGIHEEISHNATIRNNVVRDSSHIGISVVESENVSVLGNTITTSNASTTRGILLVEYNRPSWTLRNVLVRSNDVTMCAGRTGIEEWSVSNSGVFSTARGNRFENNTYRVPVRTGLWWTTWSRMQNWWGWQGSGQDRDGRLESADCSSPAPADPIIAAAGDIACPPSLPVTTTQCRQQYTSNIIVAQPPDAVLIPGDVQYERGELTNFQQSYHPTWGRFKSITRPAPGNHEYYTPGASGYFDYFGAAAGDRTKGYYSFDLGAWHIISLNSNCQYVACYRGSPQELWLRADLAAHPNTCTLAYWHHPKPWWSTTGETQALFQALYEFRADVVLTGHDHNYQRFAPVAPNNSADPSRGIRQFIVGTGGRSLYTFTSSPAPNTVVRQDHTFGVLKMTLHPTSYGWQFIPEAGKTFTDSGSAACV